MIIAECSKHFKGVLGKNRRKNDLRPLNPFLMDCLNVGMSVFIDTTKHDSGLTSRVKSSIRYANAKRCAQFEFMMHNGFIEICRIA